MSVTRKRIFIVLGLLGVILFVLALSWPSAPVSVEVGFLGYTNGASGERLARFAITNQSDTTIRRWGIFDRQVKRSWSLAYTVNIGSQALLSPGQTEVILVPLEAKPAFSYEKDWRAVFYWRREDLKTRFDIWAAGSTWLPTWLRGSGIRVYPAPSEWMDP